MKRPSATAIRSQTWSQVRGRAARRNAFNLAKARSIGLKSGLYGGRKRRWAPTASMAARTAGCLCTARLSSTTTSPGQSPARGCSMPPRWVGRPVTPQASHLSLGQRSPPKLGLLPRGERPRFTPPLNQPMHPRPTHVVPRRDAFRVEIRIPCPRNTLP